MSRLFPGPFALILLILSACGEAPSAGVRCGNGKLDSGEACDRGKENSDLVPGACRSDCTPAGCGDGVIDPGEECDDGPDNSDQRSPACRTTCLRSGCGDGIREEGEGCDDGAANSDVQPGACRTTCVPPGCGDGVVDPGEECDDGEANGDAVPGACKTNCLRSTCGDGVVDPGEECDDGEANDDLAPEACRTTCRRPHCGDGVIGPGESCDDGPENSDTAPDACRRTCVPASCGDGTVDGGEGCDDGPGNSDTLPDACRSSCLLPTCGDGVVDLGEECDDGVPLGDDGCSRHCRVQAPEVCIPAGEWSDDVPVLDLREVGEPHGTGFVVTSSLLVSGADAATHACGSNRAAFFAYRIPVAGDLVAELELETEDRGVLGVWRSCTAAPVVCEKAPLGSETVRVIVPDVSPNLGVVFLEVTRTSDWIYEGHFVLRVDVRPHLAAGAACTVDGWLGRCDPGQNLTCGDPDGGGTGTCVPLLGEGDACDPAGLADRCGPPLACREGRCGPSCGDGRRQSWEECDDGNQFEGDTCSPECIGQPTNCAGPFDLNSTWDPQAHRAEWLGDTSRSEHTLGGMCGAGSAWPDQVAVFVAPETGRYHLSVVTPETARWLVSLAVLETCDQMALPVACGTTTSWVDRSVSFDLVAGQRIFAVVDAAGGGDGGDPAKHRGPFTLTLIGESCGNGVVEGGEECDDGNGSGGDRCLADCTLPGDDCSTPYPLPPPDARGISEWHGSPAYYRPGSPPSCGSTSPPDAVALFTAPVAGRYSFALIEGGLALGLRPGSCTGGTELACGQRSVLDPLALEATLAAGERIWIFVSSTDPFLLQVRRMVCGDGVVAPPEECDDGNTVPGDACDADCRLVPVAEVEPNDLRSQAQVVPMDVAVAGTLTPGDRDYLAVDLVAGSVYTIRTFFGAYGSCLRPEGTALALWLYGPDGDLVDRREASSPCRTLVHVARTSGRHFLRLDEAGAEVSYFLDIRRR